MVGGISAGGNLTAGITHLYRDDGLTPPLTGAYLSIPAVLDEDVVPEKYKSRYLSRKQNENAPILDKASMDMFYRMFFESSTIMLNLLVVKMRTDP